MNHAMAMAMANGIIAEDLVISILLCTMEAWVLQKTRPLYAK